MASLCISLLGPFQVALDGEPATGFQSNKVRALLAYLATEAHRLHDRDVLAGLLWPEWPHRSARSNLRYALSNLRQAIGDRQAEPPFLLITRDTIQFNAASDYQLDAAPFVARPGQATPADDIDGLTDAVERFRGPFLEGFSLPDSAPFEEWALLTRERIGRSVMSALQRLAARHEERGELEQACAYVRRQLELEPWQEASHQQLMRLLAASGRRSEALAQYEACRRLLSQELQVDPAAATTELYEAIRDGRLEIAAPRRSLPHPATQHNLPISLVPFVGREEQLAQIASRLQDPACRLLTLVGPGGCGKTRLAIEAAMAQTDRFAHGVWFVPLAPLESAAGVVTAIGQTLRLPALGSAEPRAQLFEYLRSRNMLLVLDDFEHCLEAAGLVTDILSAAQKVQVMVTSRVQLGLRGEDVFPLAGMDCPGLPAAPPGPSAQPKDLGQYSAVRLFVQSASRAQPGYQPTPSDLQDVARICSLVDGMPLGILLAASWADTLAPADIAAQVEKSLDFLETEWRDVPLQQRSLRAVFDRSWSLLSESEQHVFQALSVFRGGFTRAAAQEVGEASLKDLKALVAKSFLQLSGPTSSGGAWGRYDTHGLLRHYAAEKLAQWQPRETEARNRHSACYARALGGWAADIKGSRQQAALTEVEPEGENLRLAWSWAVERGDVEAMAQAMEGLQLLYWLRGRYLDGEAAMRTAADRLAEPHLETGQAERPAQSAGLRGRYLDGEAAMGTAADRLAEPHVETGQAERPASFAGLRGPYLDGEAAMGAAADRLAELTGPPNEAERPAQSADLALRLRIRALTWQSNFCRVLRRPEETDRLQRQALELLDSPALAGQDTRFERALLLQMMARTLVWSDHERATQLLEQALPLYRQVGDLWRLANVLEALGRAAFAPGRVVEAHQWLEESLSVYRSLGNDSGACRSLAWLSRVNIHLGHFELARRQASQASDTLRAHDNPAELSFGLGMLTESLLLIGQYREADIVLDELFVIWGEWGRPDYTSYERAFRSQADLHLGHLEDAEARARYAIDLARQSGPEVVIGYGLLMLGAVAIARGSWTNARQLLEDAGEQFVASQNEGDLSQARALLASSARGEGNHSQALDHLANALRLGQESACVPALIWALPVAGLLLADQGKAELAVELYALASRYPIVGNSRWFEDVFGKHIAAAASDLPPEAIAAGQERGRARDLEATVQELLSLLEA